MVKSKQTRAFVLYSRDSATDRERVLALAQRLRADGIDCWLEDFVAFPAAEGWPRRIQSQIDAADFVLVVCTPHSFAAAQLARAESSLRFEFLAKSPAPPPITLVPILFDDSTPHDVPSVLRRFAYFRPDTHYAEFVDFLRQGSKNYRNEPLSTPRGIGWRPIIDGLVTMFRRASRRPDDNRVLMALSYPRTARPDVAFVVRFGIYAAKHRGWIRAILRNAMPKSRVDMDIATSLGWQKGTRIKIRAYGNGLECIPSEQDYAWNGDFLTVDFDGKISAHSPSEQITIHVDVCVEDVVISRIRREIRIRHPLAVFLAWILGQRISIERWSPRTAFASYASQDMSRVLDRVRAIEIATGIDVFVDCLSLNPSDKWKERLEVEIVSRDVFMLFWSKFAASSPWVDWEWRTAVRRKGLQAVQPQPLDPWPTTQIPDDLAPLHFGDPAMAVRAVAAQESSEEKKP